MKVSCCDGLSNKSKYPILYRHTRKTGKGQANISPFSVKSVVFYPESMRIQAVRYMSPVQYIQNFKVIFTVNKTVNKLFAMSQIMLVALALKIRFSMSLEKMYTLSKEFENSLLESNSKHTSFYTVNLKHSVVDARRKTHL